MFTFGRKLEIECAWKWHGGPEKAVLIVRIIDTVHDWKEGKATLDDVMGTIETAIIEGRRDIWDAAGTWALKIQKHEPSVERIWLDLARHPRSEIRLRIACHIHVMPVATREKVYTILKDDRSRRVREMAKERWDFACHPEKYDWRLRTPDG